MSTTTVSTSTANPTNPEPHVPFYRVGQPVIEGCHDRVTRTEVTPGGSQTVWTGTCPEWCGGHNPDEVVEDIAQYDWSEHLGPDLALPLPGLVNMTGENYREHDFLHLDLVQVAPLGRLGWHLPLIEFRGRGSHIAAQITAPEARSLAALLLRFADIAEG